MTLNQGANYTPKHRRDVEYVGKHRKTLTTDTDFRLAAVSYSPRFAPNHCLGASSSRAARDLGCQHRHPPISDQAIAAMTRELAAATPDFCNGAELLDSERPGR